MTNVKFLNPFIDAAVDVLRAECGLDSQRGVLSLQKLSLTTDDVTVLISLVGQVQGVVLYGLSKATATRLVSRVMGQDFSVFDNLAQSGIAELGNVITGSATINLSKVGIVSNISPPTLVIGQGVQISTLDFPRIVVPLTTEDGTIIVHLAVKESPPGRLESNFVPVTVPAATPEA